MTGNFPAQLSSATTKSGSVPWKAFTFSGVIFGMTFIVYLGLAFGYKPFIEASIAASEARIAELDRTAPKAGEEVKFVQFYSQLMNITKLLSAHTAVMPFFNTFEANTMADVGFSEIMINVPERMANMSGFAGSYEVLAGQLAVYEKITGIERMALLSANLADRLVRFEMRANFTPEFFRFKPSVEEPKQLLNQPMDTPVNPIDR